MYGFKLFRQSTSTQERLLQWTYTIFLIVIILIVIAIGLALTYFGMEDTLLEAATLTAK